MAKSIPSLGLFRATFSECGRTQAEYTAPCKRRSPLNGDKSRAGCMWTFPPPLSYTCPSKASAEAFLNSVLSAELTKTAFAGEEYV